MSSRIKNLIKEFGFADGNLFYFRLKTHKLGWFKSAKKKMKFFLRNNGTDAGIFGQVFIDGQYEIPISFKPKTIIDAGANIGLAALYFADKFPISKIVALEPDKDNFDVAIKNTENNPNITVLQKGVWDKDTYLEIIDTTVSKDAFMVKESNQKSANSIEAITIDTIMQQQGWTGIDILKVDIEGSEKELFSANYQKWLPVTKVIFVEVHDGMKKGSSKAVFNATSKYNFSFSMKHENLIFINEDL
ncbi:MAG TPA: FkbM family methyltransferase [Ferruginibacter sp.]|nr:FkbM family methyltransferase [Ferruginibacter sp.]